MGTLKAVRDLKTYLKHVTPEVNSKNFIKSLSGLPDKFLATTVTVNNKSVVVIVAGLLNFKVSRHITWQCKHCKDLYVDNKAIDFDVSAPPEEILDTSCVRAMSTVTVVV